MNANDLRRGDVFVEHSDEEWAKMSPSDKRKARRVTAEGYLGACVDPDRIHIRTSAGDWCIPRVSPVVRLESSEATRRAQAKRPAKAA